MNDTTEFKTFDSAMNRVLSISHDELKRREAKWKKQRKRKKRTNPASHAARA